MLKRFKFYLVVFGITIVGHLLGVAREVTTAFYFGASSIADGILVGIIPLTLYASVFGSAYANAAIVHIKTIKNVEIIKDAIFTLVLVSLISSAFFLFGANFLVSIMAPGLSGEGRQVAVVLIKFSSLGVLFVTLSSLGRSLLHIEERFTRASISDLMPNIFMIMGIALLYQKVGIYGLAIGAIVGYFFQFAWVFQKQFYAFKARQLKNLLSSHQKSILKSTFLASLSYSVVYVDVLVDRYFASELYEGAIAIMNYGQKVMLLPLYTFIFAITTVIFPKLIAHQSNTQKFNKIKKQLYTVTFVSCVLITLFIIICGEQLISLLFNYGEFTQQDVFKTYQVLVVYIIGLVGHAFVLVASKVRYALNDFKTPLVAGGVGALVNIMLSILLVADFGVMGLAAATTISAILNALVLVLRKNIFLTS